MCYKAPGPRCSSHAKKLLDEKQKVFTSDPIMDNWDALMEARNQYDMTPAGQKELQEQIIQEPENTPLVTRLEKGVAGRKLALASISSSDQGDTLHKYPENGKKQKSLNKKESAIVAQMSKVPITAQDYEHKLIETFSPGTSFEMSNRLMIVEGAGKPIPQGVRQGESKTDVFVLARDAETGEPVQVKISYKRENADFLENKMTAERFYSIVGGDENAVEIIRAAAEERFRDKKFGPEKKNIRGGEETIYTLGYRADLVNKQERNTIAWNPSHEELVDIYAGTTTSPEKRNAIVPGLNGGKPIENSGVASHMLVSNNVSDPQQVIDSLIPVGDYVKQNPTVYFSLRAVNYRQEANKWDTNRPLMYHVQWSESKDGTVSGEIDLSKPFQHRANAIGEKVRGVLGHHLF